MKQIPLELQKMEMVGRIAASAIHDLNNMLTVIQLNAALLEMGGIEADEQAKLVGEINRACSCAADLTRSVLGFSRRADEATGCFEVGKVLEDLSPLLAVLTDRRTTLKTSFPTEEIWMNGSPVEFQQIILNLIINAVDSGSKIGVELSIHSLIPEGQSVKKIELIVRDFGEGISPENLPHIFEAFFTTKDHGKGTGLGLNTVKRIVSERNGEIKVESEVGRGTCFRLLLPQGTPPQQAKPKKKSTEVEEKLHATILLVEDDQGISEIGKQILERRGAVVIQAKSAVEAEEVWKARHREINLVFTDIILPGGITGQEMASAFLRDRPELKVLYTSGNELAYQSLSDSDHANFLPKPYRPDELIATVTQLLATSC